MKTREWRRTPSWTFGLTGLVALFMCSQAFGVDRTANRGLDSISTDIQSLKLDSPMTRDASGLIANGTLDSSLVGATGNQQVIVRLRTPAAGKLGEALTGEMLGRKSNILSEQSGFMARCQAAVPSVREIARTQLVLNAVFIEVDAAALPTLANDPAVSRITPVRDYKMFLGDTVPYIGASAVQASGIDGSGVKVAVLDSGIDYTHANMGGGGTLEAYEAAYGVDNADPANTTRDELFPTDKVVEGFDFVGEAWPNGPLAPDDDPIDFEGHGSHVADIIGGTNGVAPGVDLYAVKVCSAVSSSCSGIALIQGMEFAVDPNGDGDPEDRVDIINMSLGADYGLPFDDDLSAAVENASALGVLTVAAAGNGEDKPYKAGTPAAAPSALAVAQTQVPSAALQLILVADEGLPAVFQAWSSPLEGAITGAIQYGDGAGGNLDGCLPFAADSLEGLVVLIDRGACNFTAKIFNVDQAGGSVGIIGLVAPGAPFVGGFADPGGPIDIPGFMINQADSNFVKASLTENAIVDAANQLPLVMTMVSSSSRGPSNGNNAIKPEIGAPGASVSLEAGTATGETPFGGTSGATPMVAGAAALVIEALGDEGEDDLSPAVVKALLATNANPVIGTDAFSELAPITRIGGGEVRVNQAINSGVAAWDDENLQSSLSFGLVDVGKGTVRKTRWLRVKNLSNRRQWFFAEPTFRYPEDEESGAVSVSVSPRFVALRPGASRLVRVRMTIDGDALPNNLMNSGSQGSNPAALTANEFDGYIQLSGRSGPVNVAWQVLPRKAANVQPKPRRFRVDGGTIALKNRGPGTAQNDAYALLAVSSNQPSGELGGQSPTPDLRAVGVNTIQVPPGFCSADPSFLWIFAFNTWEPQTHLLHVQHRVTLDIDQDGTDDYLILNADIDGFGILGDGRQLAYAIDLATGASNAFFFAEHGMNTGNTALIVCAEQLGLGAADLLTNNIDVRFNTFDFYFGGPGDEIGGITVTPLGERFLGQTADVPGGETGSIDIFDFTTLPGNTEELGILLFTSGDRGGASRGAATKNTEALVLGVRGADLSPLTQPPPEDDDDNDDA